MEIKANNTENMTNDEINTLIKKLYQSKSKDIGGGGQSHNKVSIRTLSSVEDAFDKNAEYYEWLKIPLYNNSPLKDGSKHLFFQKNNTYLAETIWWYNSNGENYDGSINWAFRYKDNKSKSANIGYDSINIFIMNYDE